MSPFKLKNNSGMLELSIVMQADAKVPSTKDVLGYIHASDYADFYLDEEAIQALLSTIENDIKAKVEITPEHPYSTEAGAQLDAVVSFDIAKDKLSAKLKYKHAYAGKVPDAREMTAQIKSKGINRGVLVKELKTFWASMSELSPGEEVEMEIARGKDAVPGDDAFLQFLTPDPKERVLRPQKRGDGSVDMRDLGKIVCVDKGVPVAQLINATPGVHGYAVTGEKIPAIPGKELRITAGDGTQLLSNKPQVLIATRAGIPVRHETTVDIDDVYEIRDVSIATGHVEFDGSVIINGDVKEGMKVVATGNIIVKGCVESGFLLSGGNITIGQGVLGHQTSKESEAQGHGSKSAKIQASGNIQVKYANYAELISKRDILVENQLLHCSVICHGRLIVGEENGNKGDIIGGSFATGKPVIAGSIGSASGSMTEFCFDHIYKEKEAKNLRAAAAIEKKKADLKKLREAIEQEQTHETHEHNWMAKAQASFNKHSHILEELKSYQKRSMEDLTQYDNNVSVSACEVFNKETQLTYKNESFSPLQGHKECRVVYRKDSFEVEPFSRQDWETEFKQYKSPK